MQQNGKVDGKFKIVNLIYDEKKFAEDPLEIHPKACKDKSYIPEKSVDTASINSKYENSNMATSYPIKVSLMNMLILMIQIKLHVIMKLL